MTDGFPSGGDGEVEFLLRQVEELLEECPRCDLYQEDDCTCKPIDPREVLRAMSLVLKVYVHSFPIQPLSDADGHLRHAILEIAYGSREDDCRTYSFGDPPCGGCAGCIHAQTEHYFVQEKMQAERYQNAGLEWAPYVIDWTKYTDVLPGGKAPFCREHAHRKECRETQAIMKKKMEKEDA